MFMQRPDRRSETPCLQTGRLADTDRASVLMAVIPPANEAATSETSSYTYSEKVKMAVGLGSSSRRTCSATSRSKCSTYPRLQPDLAASTGRFPR